MTTVQHLPGISPEVHAHVVSRDWAEGTKCTCGRYSCSELKRIDAEAAE